MDFNYDNETIYSRNPVARFAHQQRVRKSLKIALRQHNGGAILDYGCGSGAFISNFNSIHPGLAFGYEPFMEERHRDDLPIFKTIEETCEHGPFSLVTIFETIEHLSDDELSDFLDTCSRSLMPSGKILVSAPIEIGPALLIKEFNRFWRRGKSSEHATNELLAASFLGKSASRAGCIKSSHRGFDFRRAIKFLNDRGWRTTILAYSPLPIGTWYGNSQVFFIAEHATTQ
jgi:hypothetical protein